MAPEALAALEADARGHARAPACSLVTSAGPAARRLARATRAPAGDRRTRRLLAPLAPGAALVTVLDGHPATLSWLGAVRGTASRRSGVDQFGQSADIPDLYRAVGIDADAILDACAAACLGS